MSPRKQIPPGMCRRCGAQPPADGVRICERCRQYGRDNRAAHRERNRAHYARNRDAITERKRQKDDAARLKRALNGDPTRHMVRKHRERLAHEYAAQLGHVPTAHALHRHLASKGHAMSLVGVRFLSRGAFGLRPIERWDPAATEYRKGWPVIPYPVPSEFLAPRPIQTGGSTT